MVKDGTRSGLRRIVVITWRLGELRDNAGDVRHASHVVPAGYL
jgi:hypothetical protein